MELRHLSYFVAVAEERSYTRAAARVHAVQSTVSAAIKALERDLGTSLFDRNSKRVLLTDAGAALLPRALDALDAARVARDAVDEVLQGLSGTLHIGMMMAVRQIDMPRLLGEYHRRHPRVQLRSSSPTSGSQGLVEALLERRLDLAFVALPGVPPPEIVTIEVARSILDLVLPLDHPLADRTAVNIGELAGLDFIDAPIGFGNRTLTDRAFADSGTGRRVAIEITDITRQADYVRHGLGVALLPRYVTDGLDDLRIVPVADTDLSLPTFLARPTDRTASAAARALITLVSETYGGAP
jgi:DNA-binding transcriptional LysR family regulator